MSKEIFFPHVPEPNPTVREHLLNGGTCIFDNVKDAVYCRLNWVWFTTKHLVITKHEDMYHVKFNPEWLIEYRDYTFSWDKEPSIKEKNALILAEIKKLNERNQ